MEGKAETEGFVQFPINIYCKGFQRDHKFDSPNYEPNKLVSIDTI